MRILRVDCQDQEQEGQSVVCCPVCGQPWEREREGQFNPCACVRWAWSRGFGNPQEIQYYGEGWDRETFDRAYRLAHWELNQNNDILNCALRSPDEAALAWTECREIGTVAAYWEHGIVCPPVCKRIYLGLAAGAVPEGVSGGEHPFQHKQHPGNLVASPAGFGS